MAKSNRLDVIWIFAKVTDERRLFFLFWMTSVAGFFVVRFFPRQCLWRYTDLQPLMILQHFQNQRYHRRRFFVGLGMMGEARNRNKRWRFLQVSPFNEVLCATSTVARMHIHSNMFKHHHWILISSTYPQYFGHLLYHLSCDFIWQWLNNQKHQKANVHQHVHQFHVISMCVLV